MRKILYLVLAYGICDLELDLMVGKRGVEPLLQEPESCVLPLDDFPKYDIRSIPVNPKRAISTPISTLQFSTILLY
jgi:hypothetical protein